MSERKVKLKNLDGDYLYPYTNNVPTDQVVTASSRNLITSGAVHTALGAKLDTSGTAAKATADANGNEITTTYLPKNIPITTLGSSGTIELSDNSINRITINGSVRFVLPTITDNSVFHQLLVQVYLPLLQTINVGTECYFFGEEPDFSDTGYFNIYYEYNGTTWVCGVMPMETIFSGPDPTQEDLGDDVPL